MSTSERTQYAPKTLFSLITAPILFKTIEISEATQTHPTSRLAGAVRSEDAKNPTGESHLLPVFGFVNESEDGTDIYIILTYSRMLSIGY